MPDKDDLKPNEVDKMTPLRAWGSGGPLSADQRKQAKALFLDSFESDGNVSGACAHAGISRETAYKWREKDKAFAKAWEDCLQGSNDFIRREMFRRAYIGIDSYVVSNGKLVMGPNDEPLIEQKYSDTLAMFIAKSRMPEFRDKQQVEHSGAIDFKTDWGGGILEEAEDGS